MHVFYSIPMNSFVRWLRQLFCEHKYEIIHDVPGGSPIPTKLPICFGGRVSMCVRCGKVKFHR